MEQTLRERTISIAEKLYGQKFSDTQVLINRTPPEFEGDFTVVIFPFTKVSRKNPEATANEIGVELKNHVNEIESFNVVKGFLNLKITDSYWMDFLLTENGNPTFGVFPSNGKSVMVEYGGPNTNKPLHLGHLRNILIGSSVSEILTAAGNEVVRVNIYNDRGVHICKSMMAYQKFGHNETPESAGIKGDHLVGDYYVKFEKELRRQIAELTAKGVTEEEAKKNAPIQKEVQEMLVQWEKGDVTVRSLWSKMNGWVYKGFEETFKRLDCDFQKHYHESDTYLLGKKIVEEGLEKKVFFKKPDGSIWIDLTADGLDEKLLLRADGTSVYITQDLGTADLRYKDFGTKRMIYTVATEQDYHFKVLKLVCEKLGMPYAEGIYHLSYGMVDLPTGRMKSREGTVVDADDLIAEMETTAEKHTSELGKVGDFSIEDAQKLYHQLGMGALKFYILKVDPKKRMVFNPEESIDFHGFTGPFIQYTYARIQSVKKKAGDYDFQKPELSVEHLHPTEKQLLLQLYLYPKTILESAEKLEPSLIANHIYQLAKQFNSFYAELSINNAETEEAKKLRLQLAHFTGEVIKKGMKLLGVEVPERM